MAITALTARNVTETSAGFTITFDDVVLDCVVAILADEVTVDAADLYDYEVPHSGIWYGGNAGPFSAGSYHEADQNFDEEAAPDLSPGTWYRLAATVGGSEDVFYSAPFQTAGEGDTTAPTLSFPTALNVTDSSITPRVTTDEGNGTITADLYASGDLETSLAQRSQPVTQPGAQTFSAFTGLSAGTSYVIVYGHTDAASNAATAVSVSVSTYALPIIGEIDRGYTSVEVSYTATPGALGHEYRLDEGAAVDIELRNPFEISDLSVGTSYNLQMRSYDADGPSGWTAGTDFATLAHGVSDPQIVEILPTSIRFTVECSLGGGDNPDHMILLVLVPFEDRPSGLQIAEGLQSDDSAALESSSFLLPEEPGEREILVNVGIEPEGSYTVGAVLYDASQSAVIGAPVYLDFTAPAVESHPPAGTAAITSVTPGVRDAQVAYSYDEEDADGFRLQIGTSEPVDIGTQNPAIITGLQPDTTYDPGVRVIPYNEDGDGDPSSYASFVTWPVFAGVDEFNHHNNADGGLGPHWADHQDVQVVDGALGTNSSIGFARLAAEAHESADYSVTVDMIGTEGAGALLRSAGVGEELSGYAAIWYGEDPEVDVYKIDGGVRSLLGTVESAEATERTVSVRTESGAAVISIGDVEVVDDLNPFLAKGAAGVVVIGPSSSGEGVRKVLFPDIATKTAFVEVIAGTVPGIGGTPAAIPTAGPYSPPPDANLLVAMTVIEHSDAASVFGSGLRWRGDLINRLGPRYSGTSEDGGIQGPTSRVAEDLGIVWGYKFDPGIEEGVLQSALGTSGFGNDSGAVVGLFFSRVGHIREVYVTPVDIWHAGEPYNVNIEHAVWAAPGDLVADILMVTTSSVTNNPGIVAYPGQTERWQITPRAGGDPVANLGGLNEQTAMGASTKRAEGEPDPETGLVSVVMGWKFDEGETHVDPVGYAHLIVVLSADPPPLEVMAIERGSMGDVQMAVRASVAGEAMVVVTRASDPPPTRTHIVTAHSGGA